MYLSYLGFTPLAHQFTVQPKSVIQAEGLETVFECLCPGAVSHTWRLNGVSRAEDEFPPDTTRPASGDTPARVIIPATPQYNNTVVQCEAIIREEGGSFRSDLSNNATLRVQGKHRFQINLLEQSY